MRHQRVVSVHKTNVFARSHIQSPVSGSCHTLIFLVDNLARNIAFCCKIIQKIRCTVGTPVIYENNLKVTVCLFI